MSSTLLAPMKVEYVGHRNVTPEEQKIARQNAQYFIDGINKISKPSALCGKKQQVREKHSMSMQEE